MPRSKEIRAIPFRLSRRRLNVERLERRVVMASLTWVGPTPGGWDFNLADNWNPSQGPTGADNVIVESYGGPMTLAANGAAAMMSIRNSSVETWLGGNVLSLEDLNVNEKDDAGNALLRFAGPGTVEIQKPGGPNGVVKVGRHGSTGELRIEDVDTFFAEGGIFLGGVPGVDGEGLPLEDNTSEGRLFVIGSTVRGLTLSVGYSGDSAGVAEFQDSFLDLSFPAAGPVGFGPLPDGFPALPAGVDLGTLVIGMDGEGTAEFTTSAGIVGKIEVGKAAHGTLTVGTGTYFGYYGFNVGSASEGDVTLSSGANFRVIDVLGIGISASGLGTVNVTDPFSYLELGGLVVGDDGGGILSVDDFGFVKVRHGGAATVGNSGVGNINLSTGGRLETNDALLASDSASIATVSIAGDGTKWKVNGDLTEGDGSTSIDVSGIGALEARNIKFAINAGGEGVLNAVTGGIVSASENIEIGRHSVFVKQNALMTAAGEILIGQADAATEFVVSQEGSVSATGDITIGIGGGTVQAGVFSGGVFASNATVTLDANTTLRGDSTVESGVSIVSSSSTNVIAPGPEAGGVALFTFDTPLSELSAGMTLAIDAPAANDNDRLHATGSVELGGVVALNLGFTPVPWLADVTSPGSWIRVLSADGSLAGDIVANAPDPNTLGLPTLASSEHHYEWKVVHDRDDGSPYQKLVQLNSAHSSQPWLGNGTQDVVLIVMEIPPPEGYDDAYETAVDETLDQTEGGLLDNDEYLGEDGMTAVLVAGPSHGDLTLNPDGTFSYTPDTGFSGLDTFTYKPVSGEYEGEETTVTIVVYGTSIAAQNDAYNGPRGWLLDAYEGVLINDYSNEVLTAILLTGTSHGSLSFSPDGSFQYMPNPGFIGTDTFTYVADDGVEVSSIRTVSIEMWDYELTAVDDAETVPENQQFYSWFNFVLLNDYGSDFMHTVLETTTQHGTVTLYPEGGFFYEPDPDFVGVDYFTYRATDGVVWSNVATVELTVYEQLAINLPAIESNAAALTANELAAISQAAIERWRSVGVGSDTLDAALADLRLVIADLPGSHLGGAAGPNIILIDVNAAGYGWFVDATPGSDREFARLVSRSERQAAGGSPAFGYVDLLTVLSHEIGHVLGLEHSDDPTNVMAEELSLSTRRNPTAFDAAIVEWLYEAGRRRR